MAANKTKLGSYDELRARHLTAAQRAENDRWAAEEALAINLRQLREAVGKTQTEVAAKTAMTQPQVSRFETNTDWRVSTLRRFVEALGGELQIVVRLPRMPGVVISKRTAARTSETVVIKTMTHARTGKRIAARTPAARRAAARA